MTFISVRTQPHMPGSFTGTTLEAWRHHQGIETVVIAGYMTHMCCEASIMASATPFCFSAAQKYLTIERTRSSMT